jgi:hypothetical protein
MTAARLLRFALMAAVTGAFSHDAFGYRPFDGTDAAIADKGALEIEFGPAQWRREGSASSLAAPALILNLSLTDRWELVAEAKQVILLESSAEDRHWIEDAAVSAKAVLRAGTLQGFSGPSLATELSLLVPTAPDDRGPGGAAGLIASHRWSAMSLHLNGFVEYTRDHHLGVVTGITLEGPFSWSVRPVLEALLDIERSVHTGGSGLAGLIWRVRPNVAIDAGVRRTFGDGLATTEVRSGVTWAFQLI